HVLERPAARAGPASAAPVRIPPRTQMQRRRERGADQDRALLDHRPTMSRVTAAPRWPRLAPPRATVAAGPGTRSMIGAEANASNPSSTRGAYQRDPSSVGESPVLVRVPGVGEASAPDDPVRRSE